MKPKKPHSTHYGKKPTVTTKKPKTGKVTIPETKTKEAPLAAGSHKLRALQKHKGVVKPKTAKKLEKIEHKIKKRDYGEDV
jgi:hypothetical protein